MAADPWVGLEYDAAGLEWEVPPHSTVMFVADQGMFVRRHAGGAVESAAGGPEDALAASGGASRQAQEPGRWWPGRWWRGRRASEARGSRGGGGGGGGVARTAGRGRSSGVASSSSGFEERGGGGGGPPPRLHEEDGHEHEEGAAAGEEGRRRLAQAAPPVDQANVTFNPRLACEGCPPGDPRVKVDHTSVPPFAAVGLLAQEQRRLLSSAVAQCTGTLIGPRHVLTAAHCVVAPDRWSFVEQVQFYPQLDAGRDPSTREDSVPVHTVRVLERYIRLGSASLAALNFDFALLTLARPMPAGTFVLPIAPGVGQKVLDLQTAGYPGDKPRGTMWTVQCPAVRFDFEGTELEGCGKRCDNMVIHDCVSWEGQSGSALWQTADNGTGSSSGTSSGSSPPLGRKQQQQQLDPGAMVYASGDNATVSSPPDRPATTPVSANTVRAILTGVVKMQDGTTFNVGTELNNFVYGTLASWYNEDVRQPGAQLEVPPGFGGADSEAATVTPGEGGGAGGSWLSNHVYVPIVAAALFLLLVVVSGAFCVLPLLGISMLTRRAG